MVVKRKSKKRISRSFEKNKNKYSGSVTFVHKFHIPKSELSKYSKDFIRKNGKHPKGYNSAKDLRVLRFKGSRETTSGGVGNTNRVVVNYELEDENAVKKFKKICMMKKGDIIKTCKISRN